MVVYIGLIFFFQLIGEVISESFKSPIPGPIFGMVLMLAFLFLCNAFAKTNRIPQQLESVSGGLLKNMSLLFVPVSVGVMLHVEMVRDNWFILLVLLLVSTIFSIVVSALSMVSIMHILNRMKKNKRSGV